MISLKADSIDALYIQCLMHLENAGEETHPRGFTCYELSPCSVTLTNVQRNILMNPVRKISARFAAAELLWILMGRNDVKMISHYNKKMASYSDDGQTFFGAYGPKIMPQLPYVLDALRQDPWSRQAVLTIWRESPKPTRDAPCTISLQFLQRPLGFLNLLVSMRSQDAWLGLPYDIHNFSSLQLLVAGVLGLDPGFLTIIQGSLHLYAEHRGLAHQAQTGYAISKITPCSKIHSEEHLDLELAYVEREEYAIRQGITTIYDITDPLLRQKLEMLCVKQP
jgi:thymidylate synthase